MAGNNMISLKVFLRDEGITEARRFTVDVSVVTSYIFMKEKLQTVFPDLRNAIFKITWKDCDGDEIVISSDEDFITAFTEMNKEVKVLYVTVVQHNNEPVITIEADIPEPQFSGSRIICDICDQVITGFRYKCMQCPDYDLCANCEHKNLHSEHYMMRMPQDEAYMPKCARKFMYHISRNLKKSAYAADKEAHRAAKYAHKFGTHGRCNTQNEQPRNDKEQANGSTQQPQPSLCPFTESNINLDEVHALGALARQHFGPVWEAMRNAPQPNENSAANDGLIMMDIIRNAVDKFFGKNAQENPNTPQADVPESVQPTTVSKENSLKETPMDIEGTANSQQEGDKRDPGWTFVANKPQPETAPNEIDTQTQPSAPAATFVYHENPRIAEGLVQLHEMGFSNESGYLTHLLERFEGDVNSVVKAILDMKL